LVCHYKEIEIFSNDHEESDSLEAEMPYSWEFFK